MKECKECTGPKEQKVHKFIFVFFPWPTVDLSLIKGPSKFEVMFITSN